MSKNLTGAGPTILVVDDEPAITELLEVVLSKSGYEVIAASSGAEGVRKALESEPDLIIVDIMMPEIDGYEAVKSIRQNPTLGSIPVIFLSGRDPDVDGGRSFNSGGTMYLKKPFSADQVKTFVSLALASRSTVEKV